LQTAVEAAGLDVEPAPQQVLELGQQEDGWGLDEAVAALVDLAAAPRLIRLRHQGLRR
jgi:hypothetical protein